MSVTGLVFDVQRCCLHDGPGIRTTVFFKGCPLRCRWCHNPESQALRPELSFDRAKCRGCLACVAACPHAVHRALDGRHAVDRIACVACGRCVQACPAGALKVVGELWDVPRLVREVQRDRRYYDSSGGGVTLSGGEPTAQFDFCLEALRAFRAAAIHTCLETAGYLAQDELERISEFVDLFLFDYKATDPLRHKELTGVSNVHERKNILSNVEFLLSRGAAVILRCPLVPGVNDSAEHMRGITGLAAKHPSLKGVEIMAYHNMGRDKAIQVGQQAGELDIKTADESVQQAHLQTLRDLGCANVTLG